MKSSGNLVRGGFGLILGSAMLLLSACGGSSSEPPAAQATPQAEPTASASGPVHALLKVPAGVSAPASLGQDLAQWLQSGAVSDVTRLDNPKAEEHDLSTLVILDFKDESAYEAWNTQNASSLGSQVTAKRAELYLAGGTHDQNRAGSYYLVHVHGIPTAPAHANEYQDFLDGYMSPLLEGQREAGVLNGYRLFIERDANGNVGDSVWAAQYKDAEAYERTSPIKVAIREELLVTDPVFASYRNDAFYKGLRESLAFYPADYVESSGN